MMNRRSITVYLQAPWTIRDGMMAAHCVMLKEGVHNGSAGPIFWPAHVLRPAAPAWQDAPVTFNHPEIDGVPVSVHHSPQIRAEYEIGRVVRPYFDEARKAICGTIQIPLNHPRAARIQGLKEVSVGVFSDETNVYDGEYNGESYNKCAITMAVDHLAILDGTGACSFEAGCGIRNNKSNGGYVMNFEHEANFPPEVYAANQEKDELEILASWDNFPGLEPPEIQALRAKHAKRQGRNQAQGYAEEANYPPEVKM